MSGLSRDARALLASARGAHDAGPGAKDRVRAGLTGMLGGAALGGVEGLELTGARPGAGWWWMGAKVLSGVAVVSVGAALLLGALAARREQASRDDVSLPVVATPAALATAKAAPVAASVGPARATALASGAAPITEVRSPEDLPRAAVKEVRSPEDLPRAPAQAASRAPQDSLSAEVALLRRITASLKAKDPRGALKIVGEHARRFPTGALAEEREVERIVALCALGRSDDATRATERFDRVYPSSSHQARILAACSGAGGAP